MSHLDPLESRGGMDLTLFESWSEEEKDEFTVAVVKGLIMDGVRHANSGHTGGPMSSADFAYVLYKDFLRFSPDNPDWFNRDRFVLSAGHESMLLYSLLTFVGYLNLDDLKSFRQFGSGTPGHPEYKLTPGVEATSGPLGQGVGMGVGMAIAEVMLRQLLGSTLVDHSTYVLASDGDLQEPVSLGAAAIAGHLGLGKFIMFYDANKAQISGSTSRADSTDVAKVFRGMNWEVFEIEGHNRDAIRASMRRSIDNPDAPTLIIGHTTMAKGSAGMEGDHETHGAPLPEEEILATKETLGLPPDKFYLPQEVLNHFQSRFGELRKAEADWDEALSNKKKSPEFDDLWQQVVDGQVGELILPAFEAGESLATRKAFGAVLTALADQIPNLAGGSADLEPSNQTGGFMKIVGDFSKDCPSGRNFAFGVREFPMGVILNGMALHGGVRPFGATFLVFSDYERPALRLRALQKLPVLAVYTHDSFFVGKDGPTHQPVEHIMALRAIPDFIVLRPADANEVTACMQIVLEQKDRPSALLLSRQGLPVFEPSTTSFECVRRGAYVLQDCPGEAEVILIASGSEVSLAVDVAGILDGLRTRVVSIPSWELFEEQDDEYGSYVLPDNGALKVSIEAGVTLGWEKHTGENGMEIGLDHFGASADGDKLAREFGFTADTIAERIAERVREGRR